MMPLDLSSITSPVLIRDASHLTPHHNTLTDSATEGTVQVLSPTGKATSKITTTGPEISGLAIL